MVSVIRPPAVNRHMGHSPPNGAFCMYDGAEQHNPESNSDFQRNKTDISKEKWGEEQRMKTVYGTRVAPNSRISVKQIMKAKHYDLFVSHINSDATIHDIRGYIFDNGNDVSKMRIDITSHEEADF